MLKDLDTAIRLVNEVFHQDFAIPPDIVAFQVCLGQHCVCVCVCVRVCVCMCVHACVRMFDCVWMIHMSVHIQ